jgi:hypothetical protein
MDQEPLVGVENTMIFERPYDLDIADIPLEEGKFSRSASAKTQIGDASAKDVGPHLRIELLQARDQTLDTISLPVPRRLHDIPFREPLRLLAGLHNSRMPRMVPVCGKDKSPIERLIYERCTRLQTAMTLAFLSKTRHRLGTDRGRFRHSERLMSSASLRPLVAFVHCWRGASRTRSHAYACV